MTIHDHSIRSSAEPPTNWQQSNEMPTNWHRDSADANS